MGCDGGAIGGSGVLAHRLTWHQAPESEIQDCHIFKLDNDDPVEVDRVHVQFPSGSHHVHIYRADTPEPDNVVDCFRGIDWDRWHLVYGAQTKPVDWELPEGVTIPLDPHQQLLVQVHWLNTTNAFVDPAIDIAFSTSDDSRQHLGVLFGINKHTAMAPNEAKKVRQWCAMPANVNLLGLMGHFHGLGVKYLVDERRQGASAGSTIYQGLGQDTLTFKLFDPTLSIAPSEGFEFECDYVNTNPFPITWGSDTQKQEHCNMVAYYFPATDLSTFCISDGAEVASVVASAPEVLAGESVDVTLALSDPAPSGGADVAVSASDPAALDVPATVHVDEGATTAKFAARGLRPARAVFIAADLGGSHQESSLAIGGLVLSEVYYDPTATQQGVQWIEVQNLTTIPIDLGRYSLGAAGADYTQTKAPLSFVLPPLGCAVVGGPAAWPAFTEVVAFDPALEPGTNRAAGVGLFDVKPADLTKETLPLDAVVWGAANPDGLRDASGAPAKPVGPTGPGASLRRVSANEWTTDPDPTPGICQVK